MRTVDIFAGAGGFSLGATQAGCELIACVERDPSACATSRAAGHPVIEADVADVAGWGADLGPVDLLIGGPPCQPFSSAGSSLGAEDERDGFPIALDVIDALSPTWVVLENVRGFLRAGFRAYRTWLLGQLRQRFEWVGVWLLDAADFGVPQHRRRCFLVAGPRPVEAPLPTHGDPESGLVVPGGLFSPRRTLRPWVSMGEALGLSAEDAQGPEPWRLAQPSLPTLSRDAKGYSGGLARGRNPCGAADGMYLATGVRRPTVEQSASLQHFPPDYPWFGNQEQIYRQIGNAVPPTLGAVVIRALPCSGPFLDGK